MSYRAYRPRPITSPRKAYPVLDLKSTCHSCLTVIPGDIYFNCGKISTILVTPGQVGQSSDNDTMSLLDTSDILTGAIGKRVKHKNPRTWLKAKKRAFQLRQQQIADMIAQDGAFSRQFAEIDDLLKGGVNNTVFQSKINYSDGLFNAEVVVEQEDIVCESDKVAMHYLGGSLMEKLDLAENKNDTRMPRHLSEVTEDSIEKSFVPSVTVVEYAEDPYHEGLDIMSCELSPFDDAYEIEDSVNGMFNILSDFEFTTVISRNITIGPRAEFPADGEISPLTLDPFALDRQIRDICGCEGEEEERSSALLKSTGVECRFITKCGEVFEWNVLL